MTSTYGIPTPPALDTIDGKNPFFHSKDKMPLMSAIQPIGLSPEIVSTVATTAELISPTSPLSSIKASSTRFLLPDQSILPFILPQIAAAHNIRLPNSLRTPSLDESSSSTGSESTDRSSGSTTQSSKRKRKGTPVRSPDHGDHEKMPGMVFSFPVIFSSSQDDQINESDDKTSSTLPTPTPSSLTSPEFPKTDSHGDNTSKTRGPSAEIIYRPVLLTDIVHDIEKARRSRMRARPVTRAKNKRGSDDCDSGHRFGHGSNSKTSSSTSSGHQPQSIDDVPSSRRNAHSHHKHLSAVSRSSPSHHHHLSASSPSKSNRSQHVSQSVHFFPSKRRNSFSTSSLSSLLTSDLSDLEGDHTDTYGDDEDDPDFTPTTKKLKVGAGLGISMPSKEGQPRERKEANKAKICASCRTKSTPCWRPGWRNDLFLCNSCGLRYKKTKCVCPNVDCRYIPLKSEYNAMFKKPKNGDCPEIKRCCKCYTEL